MLIVEIKSCLLDYQTDGKWQDYLPFCDRLYFAVAADFPVRGDPASAGLILADRYGAELVREPVEERLSAARRKAMMLSFARAAALRLQLHLDPILRLRGLTLALFRGALGEDALQRAAVHVEAARGLRDIAIAKLVDALDVLPAHAVGRHRDSPAAAP